VRPRCCFEAPGALSAGTARSLDDSAATRPTQFGDESGPHAQLLDEALAINRRRGDKHAIAGDLLFRAQSAHLEGRLDDCERDLDELERLVGPEPALTQRADVAYAKGDWAAAARDAARSAVIYLRLGDVGQVFLDTSTLVLALIEIGRTADALAVEGVRQAISEEAGEAPDTLPHPSRGYGERLAAARAAVPDATVAEARGRAVPARDRASWLLEIGA
jgi:hypothetical protein